MKYDRFDEYSYSNILLKNMNRWRDISTKFYFGDSNKNKIIYILFDAFNCIKIKLDTKLFPILKLFNNVEYMISTDFRELISNSFQFRQIKMLNSVEQIIGREKVFNNIKNEFNNLNLTDKDCDMSYSKLHKLYNKMLK
jgi:hypothetical protein